MTALATRMRSTIGHRVWKKPIPTPIGDDLDREIASIYRHIRELIAHPMFMDDDDDRDHVRIYHDQLEELMQEKRERAERMHMNA